MLHPPCKKIDPRKGHDVVNQRTRSFQWEAGSSLAINWLPLRSRLLEVCRDSTELSSRQANKEAYLGRHKGPPCPADNSDRSSFALASKIQRSANSGADKDCKKALIHPTWPAGKMCIADPPADLPAIPQNHRFRGHSFWETPRSLGVMLILRWGVHCCYLFMYLLCI